MLLIVDYENRSQSQLTVDDHFASGQDLIDLARRLHEMIPDAVRIRWFSPDGKVDTNLTETEPGAALRAATAKMLAARTAEDLQGSTAPPASTPEAPTGQEP